MNGTFFMRESPEVLQKLLKDKIQELNELTKKLKQEKINSELLNIQLKDVIKKEKHLKNELMQQTKILEWEVETKTKENLNIVKFSILGQLAAGVAHDLRNPLGTIKNNMLILKKKYDSKTESSKYDVFQRMDRAISRMSHQIDDVMDIVKSSPLKIEQSSLLEIINEAIDAIPDFKNVKLTLPAEDLIIECDPYKLQRVFVNLILNAIDAIEKEHGHIIIRFFKDKNTEIEIEDSGKEFPVENIQRFFEPFFTTKQKGTGLGLLTCKNIIEQHGGIIQVSVNPTIFKIILPKKILRDFSRKTLN